MNHLNPGRMLVRLMIMASLAAAGTVGAQTSKGSDDGKANVDAKADASVPATQAETKKAPGPDDPRVRMLAAILLDDERGVARLLAEGVDPNIREQKRGPALVMALQEKSFGAAQQLLASDEVDVDATNARGETALMMASLMGHGSTVDKLIAKGATVNKDGWTPLHYAASGGRNHIVSKLLAAGADIDARSPNGTTALMLTARRGSLTPYQTLLKAGADPRPVNEAKLSAADYLDKIGESDRARLLRAYSAGFQSK